MMPAETAGIPRLPGHYAIRREIGRGGMATVYLADDLKHDRQVAIKVLLPELSVAIGADRFGREIRTVARLQHPHILPLFDSGGADGALFFVMPFVDGESLRDLLARESSLPLPAVTRIVRQIGDALDYAHGQGVVHRDIKPENILLAGGQAFLADFGIAKADEQPGVESLTSIGMTVGSPAYMSPEQASGESRLDGRSDLYALGCITYELLAGCQPFTGPTGRATMAQHITAPPPVLVAVHGAMTDDVVRAVARMLAKDPNDRFATASPFAVILETAVNAAQAPSAGDRHLQSLERAARTLQTVTVLDFNNIANASDVDWLSTGIADAVSVDLRKIGGVRVVGGDAAARQRFAAARNAGVIEADLARSLARSVGARWVVWGAFQKAGARIRLTPQFGNVETGETFSVNKIDGTLDQIFELQDRIVTELAEILRIELTSFETEQIAKPQTARVTAYELYARGKQSFLVFGKESARAAAEYFRQAIVIDPNYAQAWAGLGSLLMPKYISSGNAADLDDGVHALQRAMQLDPSLGEPYAFLAYMLMQQHRYDDAIEAARASLDRDPGAFMGWYLLGAPLLGRGLGRGTLDDMARAILPLLRCRTLNPAFHPAQMTAGLIYRLRGQYAHAAYLLDEAVALERAGAGHVFLGAFVERAIIHANSGELPAALALLDMAIPKYSAMDHVYAETMTAWACFSRGRLMERAQDYSGAARDYENACQVAEANDHRLGIGSHWVRAKLGLARLAFRRGEHSVSDSLVTEATRMLQAKDRFVWINLIGCSQAESYYEIAATHALRDEVGTALEALELAIRFGWSDPHQVNHDPCFDGKRDSQPVRQLMARAASLVTLPAPFGAGGFPDLGEPGIAHVPSLRAG